MAIIKELGLEVKILIGGKAVKEYPDTEPDLQDLELGPNTKTSHCYIECQENMEFGIQCKVHAGKSPAARWAKKKEQLMIFAPSFDGGPYLQNLCIDEPGESRIDDGIVDFGDDTFRKFRFSKVSTVEVSEERDVAKDMETAKHLGLLRVGVWRGREVQEASHEDDSDTSELNEGSEINEHCVTIAEVALKGKAISLGATLSCTATTSEYVKGSVTEYFGPENCPLAVFGFKYRTTEDLQKAMIIPTPPIPSPELMVPEDRQEPATLSSPRTHSNELLDDRVRHLSFDEALRLAKERLELLPFEEILRLFGQEVKEIPLGNILQVAGERLTKLSFESVLRLAAERLEGIQDQGKSSVIIKSEGQEGGHLEQVASIKRREEELPSERASKHRRTRGRKDAIDLTEDE